MQLTALEEDNLTTVSISDRIKMDRGSNDTFTAKPVFTSSVDAFKGRPGFLQLYVAIPPISEGAAANGGKSYKQIATVYVRF